MLMHREPKTNRSPNRLPTPPPLALDLSDMDRPVGWVEGDAIGFHGFGSNGEAAHAAWVAYRAIARRLARSEGRRPMPVHPERITLDRRGDVDVVLASGRPIATLVRPGPASRSGADSFGFELRVPSPPYEARMRGLAYLAYRTLRKSGVRWAMWTAKRDRIGRERRAAREAHVARLEREVLAGMTPWRVAEAGPDAPRRAARADAVAADATAADAVAADASATPAAPDRGFDWGMAFLATVLLVPVVFLLPGAFAVPLAVALGAFTLVGLLELPRRWTERRTRRRTLRERDDSRDGPAAPPHTPDGSSGARGRRRHLTVTALSITGVAVLLLVLRTPERVALALAGVGLTVLLGRRLLATRAGWPPRRTLRVRPAPEPAHAS